MREQELEEILKQQQFQPSDEFPTFKIIKSLKDLIGLVMSALATTIGEWIVVCPAVFFVVSPYIQSRTQKRS